ncbi:S-adenosyl-L-methionine-dependent methyltransferase [Jaminaea rosea]|uniref:type I protein arginine methyltransferase n=1 Tax=Jaminaea rosea TaxID=1569628 RepID=A0A316UTU6_9BASI|nr:S-adenosyl-L-methionine-dependent methyltransferase [Jaminaea rosea]PWN28720.1 S-adenosyl-L-methionine-dependent methyltransferase [Jaminaea rosea]
MHYGASTSSQGQQQSFKLPTRALFSKESFDSPMEALAQAKKAHGVDLVTIVHRLGLDTMQVIRLINHIRRSGMSPEEVNALSGKEGWLDDDAELMPVEGQENDGLLQLDFDDLLPETGATNGTKDGAAGQPSKREQELENELIAMRMAFQDLRQQYLARIGLNEQDTNDNVLAAGPSTSSSSSSAAVPATTTPKPAKPAPVDNDTHYFASYAGNDIHQTMIEDSVRTLSYAKFLLSPRNASLLRGKTVMDVGCGSGILSLFCARAGAKRVLAIDASDVADRARKNVEANGWDGVVKVHKGKLEELGETLKEYEGKVDLIVSEWMGYFLLYESMLPSVLVARDLYLNPSTGTLAPSHCRMLLSAVSDQALLHQRIRFWENVHGFTMPAMRRGLEDEAYTETLAEDKVVTSAEQIYDLPLQEMKPRQPAFVSDFTLQGKEKEIKTIHGFLSWFDTWFLPRSEQEPLRTSPSSPEKEGTLIPGLPPVTTKPIVEADVEGIDLQGKAAMQRLPSPEEQKKGEEIVSFTTGPQGKPTHWAQTVFLLKEPFELQPGENIVGRIHVTPCDAKEGKNDRELDVEIHWRVVGRESENAEGKKKVEAMNVQLWSVR